MMLLQKIMKRLHLAGCAYWLSTLFARFSKDVVVSKPADVDEALAFLHTVSPDPGNTSIVHHDFGECDCDVELIVPCYNVELYVEQCIDSILSQKTHSRFFVTIINDGSTDSTPAILSQYARLPNVRIINQVNQGFSGARNAGIRQAHGRYLLFVDSDDILVPGAIERLVCMAEKTDADMVDGGFRRFADREATFSIIPFMASVYDMLQRDNLLPDKEETRQTNGFVCGKLIKRSLFSNIEFPHNYWFEDSIYCMLLEPLSQRIASVGGLVFRYRMRRTSISHTFAGNPKALDNLYVTLQLLADRQELGVAVDQRQYDMLLRQMFMNVWCIRGLGIDVARAVFVVQCDIVARRLARWHTSDKRLLPIERFLRQGDFYGYLRWCKWHEC